MNPIALTICALAKRSHAIQENKNQAFVKDYGTIVIKNQIKK